MSEDKYPREEARYLKVGLYIAIIMVLFVGYVATNKQSFSHEEGGEYYDVFARFNRTDGLLVGDKVRFAGVTIGKVIDAKLDDHFKAILTLEVKKGLNIPDDSSASIVSSGMVGPKYIEIEPGGSEDNLKAGSEFAYTQDAMVLEELLDRIIGIGKANRAAQKKCVKAENDASNINVDVKM